MPDPLPGPRLRLSCPGATALGGLVLLLALAGSLPAQDKREITVEWIFSDAGEEPTRLPHFAWTSGGEVLLLDTRKPKDARTFERVTPGGTWTTALDRARAWSSPEGARRRGRPSGDARPARVAGPGRPVGGVRVRGRPLPARS